MNSKDIVTFSLLIITMILWGATPLLEKIGLKDVDPLTGVLVRSVAVTTVLLFIFLITGRISELSKLSLKSVTLFSASGILAGLIAMWTYYYVLKSGMMSKVVPIAAAYPLITAIIAVFVLREGITPQRIIGIIVTIIGIILVKQS